MSDRFLIINADDFGMCHSANSAVEDLFNNGFITSSTLMTPCPWAFDGLLRAKANKKMRVGLHLTLNSEWETYRWGHVSREHLPSLLDSEGFFPRDTATLLKQAKPDEVRTEITSQLEWMLSRDFHPTHIDNHMGSLYGFEGPSYLEDVFRLCVLHNLPFRLPRQAPSGMKGGIDLQEKLSFLSKQADMLGIGIIDNLLNFGRELYSSDTYGSVKAQYISVITSIQPGISELYLHPAKESDELKAVCQSWQMRVWEYRLMLDDEVLKAIESEGISLVSWENVPEMWPTRKNRPHLEV